MKENYFTKQTIDKKSREMLQKIRRKVFIREIEFVPENAALIIIDMQNYFLAQHSHAFISNAIPVISKIKNLATAFIYKKRPVIMTRHVNSEKDVSMMAEWWSDIITDGDDKLSEIHKDLIFTGTIVIKKTQYDAFYKTSLNRILTKKKVKQIVITGVMSHLCCETTARSAFVRGYAVFFPVDGTATYNEDFHMATLINLSHGFAVPTLITKLQKEFKR